MPEDRRLRSGRTITRSPVQSLSPSFDALIKSTPIDAQLAGCFRMAASLLSPYFRIRAISKIRNMDEVSVRIIPLLRGSTLTRSGNPPSAIYAPSGLGRLAVENTANAVGRHL